MKQSTVFAALTTFVAAQVFDNLPVCSKTCLENGITRAGCALTDIPCACAKADFINTDITPCLQSTCSEQDEEAFRHIVGQICKDYWLPTATGENHLHQNRGDRFTVSLPTPLALISLSLAVPLAPTPLSFATPLSLRTPFAHYPSPPSVIILTPEPSSTTAYLSYTDTVIIVPDSSATEAPCIVHTITLTQTKTIAVTSKVPPYPTPSTVAVSTPPTTATGSLQPSLPEFTNAAEGMKVGAVVGLVGLVGLFL